MAGKNISGWCIDKLHAACNDNYMGRWPHTCNCACHNEKEASE